MLEVKKSDRVVILGDSLVKDVEQHKLRNGLDKERIFIKHFSGATVEDMKTYIIPSKKTRQRSGDITRGHKRSEASEGSERNRKRNNRPSDQYEEREKRYNDIWNCPTKGQSER